MTETDDSEATVESRWWYWIVAYPLSLLLFIPLVVIVAVMGVAVVVIGTGEMHPAIIPLFVLAILVGGMMFLAVTLTILVIFVLLPLALYLDARAIRQTDVDWDPDPVVYALLAALQFVVTPVIGLVVALYYLYRRHEVIGVP